MDIKDIDSRGDIEMLIKHFYEKVLKDDTIGIIFNKVVPIDWGHHIPLHLIYTRGYPAGWFPRNLQSMVYHIPSVQ